MNYQGRHINRLISCFFSQVSLWQHFHVLTLHRKSGQKDKDIVHFIKGDSYSHDKKSDAFNLNVYFNNEQRKVIRNYYVEEYHRGHCPAGLAKKNNGCIPLPRSTKKWRKGYPLPRNVIYYDLPSAVVLQLGRPPEGHRYIRVATDILLMAVGTGMIVDAIQDFNSM